MPGNTDWRIRNYKNLNEQRQDNEKKQIRTRSISKVRIGFFAVMLLAVLAEYLPSVFTKSFTENFTAILMILALAFPIPIVAGVIFVLYARRKHKRYEIYSGEKPRSYSQYERPVNSAERYAADKERNYVNTESCDNYSGDMDPWDIKDAKPPWEL